MCSFLKSGDYKSRFSRSSFFTNLEKQGFSKFSFFIKKMRDNAIPNFNFSNLIFCALQNGYEKTKILICSAKVSECAKEQDF